MRKYRLLDVILNARHQRARGPLLRHSPEGGGAGGSGGGSGSGTGTGQGGQQGGGQQGGQGTGGQQQGAGGQQGGGQGGQNSGGQAGQGGGQQGGDSGAGQQQGDRPNGYPLNTPVEQMTAPEQAAYWKHHSRKHENQLRETQTKLTEIERAQMTEAQRVQAERDELKEQNVQLLAEKVRTEAARAAKVPDHLWEFVTATDPAAARAQAEKLAASVKPGTATSHDQGARGGRGDTPSVASGRDEYRARKGKNKTTT